MQPVFFISTNIVNGHHGATRDILHSPDCCKI
jgi:hypothetical protein